MAKLGEVCLLKAGKFVSANDISPEYNKGLYPCFGGNGIRGYVADYTHDGEFPLIGRQGALCGNVNLASGKFHATEHAVVVQPKIEMNVHWLYYALNAMNLGQYATGAAQPGLAVSKLETLSIEIPNISEQNKIAQTLYKVEQLVNFRKQQLAKLDELVKARFVETSKEWQAVPGQLNEFLEDITYGFTNPMPDAEEGPWKVTAKDVVNGHINILTARKTTNEAFERLTNKSKPRKGDVLLTKDGTLGRVAVVDVENLCVNQSVAVMRCNNKIYPEFLAMILQMPEYQRKLLEDSGGGTIKHLYITKVDKMLISVPDLVIQKELLVFAKRVEQQRQTVQQSLEKLELMKKALMQEYFG